MPLPAIAAVAARVVGSAAVKTVAKSALKTGARMAVTKALTPERPGHQALSQQQFPQSPPWG